MSNLLKETAVPEQENRLESLIDTFEEQTRLYCKRGLISKCLAIGFIGSLFQAVGMHTAAAAAESQSPGSGIYIQGATAAAAVGIAGLASALVWKINDVRASDLYEKGRITLNQIKEYKPQNVDEAKRLMKFNDHNEEGFFVLKYSEMYRNPITAVMGAIHKLGKAKPALTL